MEFTSKKLQDLLELSHVALVNALKNIPCKSKKIESSTRPVKHYQFEDLPKRYQKKLEKHGYKLETKEETINIGFTSVYLTASKHKREKAILKCQFIEKYFKRDDNMNQEQWLRHILRVSIDFDVLGKVSTKQLNDWIAKYKAAKQAGTNVVEAFIDRRGAKAGAGVKSLSEEMKKVAEAYFIKDTFIQITDVHLNMLDKFGETLPSYDVLLNYYKEWKRDNPLLYAFAQSPDGAKNKFKPAVGNMSAKAKHKNHYWELDSTPADIICEDGKRYAIMAAMDVYSRRVVFHVAETSNSYSIAQLLRKAILTLGIPQNVIIDNGKDYTSNHFMSVCYNLKINPIIVPPFSGEKKPHIERVFGTLSRQLFMQVAGFVGSNVSQREKIQARQSFAQKVNSIEAWRALQSKKTPDERKQIRDAWKIKKENLGLELNVLKTANELQDMCDKWVHRIYERKVHKSIEMTPVAKWQQCVIPAESISDPNMLNLLLGESVIRKVGKKGISFDKCNYAHEKLIEHLGKSVFILAPDDMGYIFVHDMNMNFICIAEDLEHTGQSRAVSKKIESKWNALTRHLDKMLKEAKNLADVTIETRIENIKDEVDTYTITVPKQSEMIDALKRNALIIETEDLKALEKSNKFDFKNKDESGKPTKVLPSGRPPFKSKVERFVWVLEHQDKMNDRDKVLMDKHPDLVEIAKQQLKIS
ncbi:DNA transposition protein [Malaciobacter mytili LMG 24559]|uniref:DNA transposition protein n=1 Tax=Malaciobacter mytili LMG 24559 TaxID=1032238 RepID=A0AAX2AI96_9BACT|nr:DDE-type integrase/transposase/recombinase [Malaciobacter mytili]AXH14347.1 prophage Mu, DNA transposition protein A [Malaciobacter mytili LMG 24559]RXK16077.1 DNA transposition protein [Malaciobacter mytili LMG 24559]